MTKSMSLSFAHQPDGTAKELRRSVFIIPVTTAKTMRNIAKV